MENFHNKVTHIYSVAMHVCMVYTNTLFPYTCQMMFDGYDDHAVL